MEFRPVLGRVEGLPFAALKARTRAVQVAKTAPFEHKNKDEAIIALSFGGSVGNPPYLRTYS